MSYIKRGMYFLRKCIHCVYFNYHKVKIIHTWTSVMYVCLGSNYHISNCFKYRPRKMLKFSLTSSCGWNRPWNLVKCLIILKIKAWCSSSILILNQNSVTLFWRSYQVHKQQFYEKELNWSVILLRMQCSWASYRKTLTYK